MQTTGELVAGRELDALIAYSLFGWARRTIELNDEQAVTVPADWTDLSAKRWWGHDVNELVPPYSTSIEAAWQVVEHLREQGWHVTVEGTPDRSYEALVYRPDESAYAGIGDTAPLAICRAALAAVD